MAVELNTIDNKIVNKSFENLETLVEYLQENFEIDWENPDE